MKWYEIAKSYIGTKEVRGKSHNPKIVKMFADVGFPTVTDDETAWCAAFVGACLRDAGQPYLKSLAARSYLNYGKKLTEPKEGAIVVFWRGSPNSWQGHVGFVSRWDAKSVWVVGGNQSNTVSEQKFSRSQVLGFRYPTVEAVERKVEKEVIKKSSKLSWLQTIRRFFTFLGTGLAGIFTMDSFNTSMSVVSQVKTTMEANLVPITLGTIVIMFFILKWVEWKQLKDFKEGRYVPSGAADEKEVTDGTL